MAQCRKVTAYKLVDVPDLGYTAADLPNPRGELRIKTRNMISEYYKSPEVRAALYLPATLWHCYYACWPFAMASILCTLPCSSWLPATQHTRQS